ESEFPSFYTPQFHSDSYSQPRRCRCLMSQIDCCTHSLLIRPVYMRVDCLNTGPFEQANHKSRSQYLWHNAELGRFRIKMRHGLVLQNLKAEFIRQPWL